MKIGIEVRSFLKVNFCCSIHGTVREIFSLQICCIIWIALPKGTDMRKVEETKSEGQLEEKGQKGKQRSTEHHTKNQRSSNTNSTNYLGGSIETRMIYKIIMTTINYFETFSSVLISLYKNNILKKAWKLTDKQKQWMHGVNDGNLFVFT